MREFEWWQEAVFYQIYPRSFADANGDGIGDFQGMIEKLDYLQDLGIDAIWLSPHFPSPQADCGYDISDYKDVAPEYGTLQDFRAFLEGAHSRGIRVILDLVLNHTSDQHPWFRDSRASLDDPKRDWYVWRDGKTDKNGESVPPNNWESTFTGSAWEYDARTGQYYYHHFLREQPDLNWRNTEVKSAMWEVVRFWLDMGADGYRLDAIATIFEDPKLPDQKSGLTLVELYQMWEAARSDEEREAFGEKWRQIFRYQIDQPGLHELMKELRQVVDAYPDTVLVGEDEDVAYMGAGDELQLVFNFPLMRTQRLTADHVRRNQRQRLSELPEGGWPCNTLGNHDGERVWSAYGDGDHDRALAQLSAALVLTLKGTPFLYYGEEIGMTNRYLENLSQFRDTLALRQYELMLENGIPREQAFSAVQRMTRDVCRTPMQWANAPNAGFSPAATEPWLPVHDNYAAGVNVRDQESDPTSMLAFYKTLLAVRRRVPALRRGDYTPLLDEQDNCLCFLRTYGDQRVLVLLNFSEKRQAADLSATVSGAEILYSSTSRSGLDDPAALAIAPFEILIAEL